MSSVSVSVTPTFQAIGRAFRSINIARGIQKAIEAYAFIIESEAKKETPVDTGRLRASIGTSIYPLRAVIGPYVKYAEWIHEGKMIRGGRLIRIKGRGRAGTPPGGKPYMKLGETHAAIHKNKIIGKELENEIHSAFRILK